MMSQGFPSVPPSNLGFVEDQNKLNPDSSYVPETQSAASSSVLKRKRNLPGTPDPDSEVVALSPNSLMATNKFLCEVCKKGFQRDQNLQLHRRGHNLPWKLKQRSNKEVVKKKVYICPEKSCVHHDPSRALGDLTGIKKHFYRKHGEKKWKCDKCSKKYAVKSDWKAHSKICGTREHKCDCGTLFSRKDSFITHRAFCSAAVDQNSSRSLASSCGGFNNKLSLRNDYLAGVLGNPQSMEAAHQFSSGGFYPELSSGFHPYGHVNNVDGSKSSMRHNPRWLDHNHPLNASTHFLIGNPAANLSHEQLLQHTGHTNLFGSSSQAPWVNKCTDHQSAFGNANMSSLDQIIENASANGGMQVKSEDGMLSNEDFVENMTSLYNPSNSNHQLLQQAAIGNQCTDQFLSTTNNFIDRNNNNNSLRFISSGLPNEQAYSGNNNIYADNSFVSDNSYRPLHLTKNSGDNNTVNLNHLILLREAIEASQRGGFGSGGCGEYHKENKEDRKQEEDESSKTRDFLGVGGNEIITSREQFQLADDDLDLDMSQFNQRWKQYN